jgi:hypothetical protein
MRYPNSSAHTTINNTFPVIPQFLSTQPLARTHVKDGDHEEQRGNRYENQIQHSYTPSPV